MERHEATEQVRQGGSISGIGSFGRYASNNLKAAGLGLPGGSAQQKQQQQQQQQQLRPQGGSIGKEEHESSPQEKRCVGKLQVRIEMARKLSVHACVDTHKCMRT